MTDAARITWLDNVSKFFTQYDAIQMRFRLDLSDYASVKSHAQAILLALSAGHPNTTTRMPLNEPAWSDAQLAGLKRWIDDGFWYSQTSQTPPAPPPPDPELSTFMALSSALTGFDVTAPMDQLHPADKLAAFYLKRIRHWKGSEPLHALMAAFKATPASLPELAASATYSGLCRQLILLWYTGALVTIQGSGPSQVPTYDFGALGTSRYASGLVWQAAQAHPMGYSIEQFGYWANEPEGTAWTGLGQSSGV